MRGLFITFEGPDGSGKSTQIRLVAQHFEARGHEAVMTREPGGTAIGEKIRAIILDRANSEMAPMTEALLYAASRAQHVAEMIRPNLEAGKTVICDRFVDSSIVYQGYGRNLGDPVRVINDYAIGDCIPDATFLLKIDPSVLWSRRRTADLDRLEMEKLEYHQAVYAAYLELERRYPGRFIGIDASRGIGEISREICGHIDRLVAARSADK